ncbi:ABC transporter permease [Halopenitus sp. H-Gu1]|uniref:ABC transporter permease n=1 Tax=Halopenitus sp. H-Gu1 TaxID=3242697 RepID=UPI00359E3C53
MSNDSGSFTAVVQNGIGRLVPERVTREDHVVVLALLVIMAVFTYSSQYFLTPDNLTNILRQTAIVTILSLGMTYVIISAEIDVSVGAVMALSAMLAALVISSGYGWFAGALTGLSVGGIFGLVNGWVTTRIGIPSFLVTLGTLGAGRGLALMVTDTKPVPIDNATFFTIFSGNVGPVPKLVVWTTALCVVAHVVLSRTQFGRHAYATGDQEQAARFTGISTKRVKLLTLTISGLMAGMAGLLLVGRLSAARPTMGAGIELSVIAAVIIGGTSLFGGRGWIPGTIIGALLMSTIDNGLVLNGFGTEHQQFVRGIVIILAVALRKSDEESGWI